MPDAPRVVLLLGSSLSSFHSVLVVHCYPCVPSLVHEKKIHARRVPYICSSVLPFVSSTAAHTKGIEIAAAIA